MARSARIALTVVIIVGGFLALFPLVPPDAAAIDTGFQDDLVTTLAGPTALAFTPDGPILATTQLGQLRVYVGAALLAAPALDLAARGRFCSNSERGLLGIAVDPNFTANHFIYLYYTVQRGSTCGDTPVPANRVTRWTLGDDNQASGEVVLIDNIPSPAGNHNGGDLNFGKDGLIYASVGDGGSTPETARQLYSLNGRSYGSPRTATFRSAIPTGARIASAVTGPAGSPTAQRSARRSMPPASAIPSAWRSTRIRSAHASSSTMSGRIPGRRSTRRRLGRTTAGMCARGIVQTARRPIAVRRRRV